MNGTLTLSDGYGTSSSQPATDELINASNGNVSFTDAVGHSFASYGVNDNGQIVGNYTTSMSGANNVIGYVYNYNTGTRTILSDPNSAFGTLAQAINNAGEVVGYYADSSSADHMFSYTNGAYADVNIPGISPFKNGSGESENIASGVTSNGTVVAQNIHDAANGTIFEDSYIISPSSSTTDTATFNVVGNGTVDLRSTSQLAGVQTIQLQEGQAAYTSGAVIIANTEQTVYLQGGMSAAVSVASDTSINTQNPNAAGIIIFGANDSDVINLGTGNDTVTLGSASETVNGGGGNNTFYVSSSTIGATINGGSGQNTLDVTGGGTVTMGSNITNVKTVNLAAAPSGQTQPNYAFTANGTAGLTVNDLSSGSDTLSAGNVTGDTLSVYGTSGNKTLTVQDTLSNNPGADWNNTLNAGSTSGNDSLTVGDGSYDLLRTDWSSGTNSLTAGNGSNDWLDAESSTGTNTLRIGNGNNNTVDTSFSSGNNTLTVGDGSGNYLNAGVTHGVNILVAGNGNNDTLDVGFSGNNNALTAGNGNGDYLTANSSTGNNVLTAGNGTNDTISAVWSTGQNTFVTGTGNTTLDGGEGYTTYKFGAAFGQDTLYNSGSSAGQGASTVLGEVDFTSSSTSYENLWFAQNGNDLVVQLLGTSDTITIKGWFSGTAGTQVQTFKASGLSLASTAVASLVSAMATYQAAHTSFNPSTATQMPGDSSLQAAITNAWPGSVNSSNVTVAYATANQATLDAVPGGYTVADSSANVVAGLTFLTSDAGHITSISLADSSTPTLALTAAQYSADTAALAKIASAYNLSISGVTAANASSVAGAAHVTSVTVSDTAANVVTNIASLQTLATGTKLTSIALTDSSTPTMSFTAAQYSANAAALAKIASAYNLSVSGVSAANAATVAGAAHVTSITVSDTAANVVANIAALQTLATGTQLSSIALTDGTTPTLALTAAQYSADSAALGKISSAYNLSVSGVSAANASTVAGNAHVTSMTVSDTGANVLTNIAALQTLATGTKLSSIALTDGSTPTLALTSAQYTADTAALGKIGSAYNLTVFGVSAANASTVTGNAHVTSITVSDTGANIVANIATLQTIGSKLSSIALTDSSTPTLALTAAQFTADSAVLGKISSAYNLSITQSGVNFVFAKNTLNSVTVNGSSVTFAVSTIASGFTETISWTPGNRALLNLTNSSNQTFASSLGTLTSGETVQVSNSLVSVLNSSGQTLNATQVNADGSQADINYNLGTGNWATNTYYYNAAGAQTEIGWTNKDGTASASYYNPALSGDPLEVSQNVNANGSGTLSTVNSQTVTYATGDTPTISFGTTGDNIATFTTNSGTGPVDVIDMSTSTITATAGTNRVVDSLSGTSASIDGAGVITLTALASGFGNDTLTVNSNGNDRFTLLSDSLTFAGSALQSISFANSAFTYGLASSAAGYSENINWNPTTGKAILNLINSSNVTVAESLGYINPGYVIAVNGNLITNTNSSAQVMNSILINADGSQVDTNYDTVGGTWKDSIYYYSNTGVNTEVRYDNNNGTLVDDFYNSSGTLVGQTVYNGDSILHSNNSNVTNINTTGMTTLDVTGSSSLTAAELSGFTSLTNGTGSADTLYATTAGTYSIAGKSVTGNFNLSAANTTANVNLTGNNQTGQVLTGGTGADTLTVGTGNDTLNGGTGYTTYNFGTAFGQDTINNAFAGNTTAKGEIDFASGITDEKLWFVHSGNDLLVDLLGTSDQIKVTGWFGSNAGAQVQSFNAGGLILDSQVAQLVSAMATYQSAHSSFNPATATSMPTDTTLQNAITGAWHH